MLQPGQSVTVKLRLVAPYGFDLPVHRVGDVHDQPGVPVVNLGRDSRRAIDEMIDPEGLRAVEPLIPLGKL